MHALSNSEPTPWHAQAVPVRAPERTMAEAFVRSVFARHHAARVTAFMPDLMVLKHAGGIVAAAGWRGAGHGPLFLESYLDRPVEWHISQLAGQPVARGHIAEVGHLAATQPGAGARLIPRLAARLHDLGHEWAVFTATRELIGILTRLGLPPLALAPADPARLGAAAADWGRYYQTGPVVVAGRVRAALSRHG